MKNVPKKKLFRIYGNERSSIKHMMPWLAYGGPHLIQLFQLGLALKYQSNLIPIRVG